MAPGASRRAHDRMQGGSLVEGAGRVALGVWNRVSVEHTTPSACRMSAEAQSAPLSAEQGLAGSRASGGVRLIRRHIAPVAVALERDALVVAVAALNLVIACTRPSTRASGRSGTAACLSTAILHQAWARTPCGLFTQARCTTADNGSCAHGVIREICDGFLHASPFVGANGAALNTGETSRAQKSHLVGLLLRSCAQRKKFFRVIGFPFQQGASRWDQRNSEAWIRHVCSLQARSQLHAHAQTSCTPSLAWEVHSRMHKCLQ